MEMAAEFTEAHAMSCRLKLKADRVFFPRMMVVLIPPVVPAPPMCADATDGKASARAESSTGDDEAAVGVVNIRNDQTELRRTTSALRISVFVFNSANIPIHQLKKAEVRAGEVFEKLGIKLIWAVGLTTRDTIVNSPGEAWNPCNFDLRIWTRPMARGSVFPSNVLGFRLSIDKGQGVVLSDAIQNLASMWEMDGADVLGLAIAHEIGHLLLDTSSHSSTGVMRAQYFQKDLISFERGRLIFSGKESDCMRREVRRRMSMQVGASSPVGR
jgi:hypothetical protein